MKIKYKINPLKNWEEHSRRAEYRARERKMVVWKVGKKRQN